MEVVPDVFLTLPLSLFNNSKIVTGQSFFTTINNNTTILFTESKVASLSSQFVVHDAIRMEQMYKIKVWEGFKQEAMR